MSDNNQLPIETRLYKVKSLSCDKSHLILDDKICLNCANRVCLSICPAKVYKLQNESEKVIMVNYENCLECGACKICCKHIKWSYPEVRYGISYKFG